jgi:hypothetical protein
VDDLGWIFVASAAAGATYPPSTAAIRRAWTDMTAPGTGRHELRSAAIAAETSLFELVFVLGPILVAVFLVATTEPAAALICAGAVTLAGTAWVARLPVMRHRGTHDPETAAKGLGPLRAGGFPALLLCVTALGTAFGAAGVIVPAYASQHGGGEAMGGVLLGVWGIGSTIGGIWFGTRRPAMHVPFWLARGPAALFERLPPALLTRDQLRMLEGPDNVVGDGGASMRRLGLGELLALDEQLRRAAERQ